MMLKDTTFNPSEWMVITSNSLDEEHRLTLEHNTLNISFEIPSIGEDSLPHHFKDLLATVKKIYELGCEEGYKNCQTKIRVSLGLI